MAKHKKKRNKQYSGAGAAKLRPTVTHISAANRSSLGQWWFERKRIAKPVGIAVLVLSVIVWLIIEFISIISGA